MPRGAHPVTTGARARRLPVFGLLAAALALGTALIAACSGDDGVTSPPDFWADIAAGTAKSDGTYGRVADLPHDVEVTPDALIAMKRVGSVSNDLFMVKAGDTLGRDNRVGRGWEATVPIETTVAKQWISGHILTLDGRHLINVTDYEFDINGHAVAVVEEGQPKMINQNSDGHQTVQVVDGVVFVTEILADEMRCYRGSLDEWILIFAGHSCEVTKSGHILGVVDEGLGFGVGVRSPSGRAAYWENRSSVPKLSENGRFLIYSDATMVRLEEIDGQRRTFEWAGTVEDTRGGLASHPDGHVALALTGTNGGLGLLVVPANREARILAELDCGQLHAAFASTGNLFWSESESVQDWPGEEREQCSDRIVEDSLGVWAPSTNEHKVVHRADRLELVGVHSDAAITVTVDEFGALFERSFPNGQIEELLDLAVSPNDDDWFWGLLGNHLYVQGKETVASISLESGQAVVEAGLDTPYLQNVRDGTMVVSVYDYLGTEDALLVVPAGDRSKVAVLRVPSDMGEYIAGAGVTMTEEEIWASFWKRSDGSEGSTVAFTVEHGYLFDPLLTYADVTLAPSTYSGPPWATSLVAQTPRNN